MSYEVKQDEFQRFLMENINHEFNFLSFCINFSLVICRNKKHLHISGGLIACSTVLNVKAPSTISDVELISLYFARNCLGQRPEFTSNTEQQIISKRLN